MSFGTRPSKRSWERDSTSRRERQRIGKQGRFGDGRDKYDYIKSKGESKLKRREINEGQVRFRKKGPLAGLIFRCSRLTRRECFKFKVLGLPLSKMDLVERVVPGTKLFLFDCDRRELDGIFEAVCHGGMDLEPDAFPDFEETYRAQVRFDIYRECLPLSEDAFRDAIRENYYSQNKFDLELSADQVAKLTQLFRPTEPSPKRVDTSGVMDSPFEEANLPQTTGAFSGHSFGEGERSQSTHLNASATYHAMDSRFTDGDHFTLPVPGSQAYGRGYVDSSLGSSCVSNTQFQEPGPSGCEREGHAQQVVRTKLLVEGNLLDPAALLERSEIEEVDQLALRYLQADSRALGAHSDPLYLSCVSDEPLTNSLIPHNANVVTRMQPLPVRGREASNHRLGCHEASVLQHPGVQVAASQASLVAAQAADGRSVLPNPWNQVSNMQPPQLLAPGPVCASISSGPLSSIAGSTSFGQSTSRAPEMTSFRGLANGFSKATEKTSLRGSADGSIKSAAPWPVLGSISCVEPTSKAPGRTSIAGSVSASTSSATPCPVPGSTISVQHTSKALERASVIAPTVYPELGPGMQPSAVAKSSILSNSAGGPVIATSTSSSVPVVGDKSAGILPLPSNTAGRGILPPPRIAPLPVLRAVKRMPLPPIVSPTAVGGICILPTTMRPVVSQLNGGHCPTTVERSSFHQRKK